MCAYGTSSHEQSEREFGVRVKKWCGAVCCHVLQFVAVSLLQSCICAYCTGSDKQLKWEFEVRVRTLCGAVCCRVLPFVVILSICCSLPCVYVAINDFDKGSSARLYAVTH